MTSFTFLHKKARSCNHQIANNKQVCLSNTSQGSDEGSQRDKLKIVKHSTLSWVAASPPLFKYSCEGASSLTPQPQRLASPCRIAPLGALTSEMTPISVAKRNHFPKVREKYMWGYRCREMCLLRFPVWDLRAQVHEMIWELARSQCVYTWQSPCNIYIYLSVILILIYSLVVV